MKFRILKKIIIATAAVLLSAIPEMSLLAEMVFMKDGSIIEGSIVSDSANYVVMKKKSGGNEDIDRKKILRIFYGTLNKSKLYVQKRDGNNFVAFLVDEDRDVYVFRKELYKPDEITVLKKDVLFMSEKNPSALKGEASSYSVALSWLSPFGQVKNNKIYIKTGKGDKYKLIGTTGDNNITISGLDSQKNYFFIVRAVDDTGQETNPSNEIQVTTKSSPPDSPVVKAEQDPEENWVLTWNEAEDKDGTVEKYRVYIEKNGVHALLEETRKLTVTIPEGTDFDSVCVKTVDNNGDESITADYRNVWRFLLSPQYCIPTGKMTRFAGNGFGAEINVSRRDLFSNDLEFGLTGGYLKVEGRQKIGEGDSNVTSLVMYPAALFTAYRIPVFFNKFELYDVLSFFPKFSAGVMVTQIDYELFDSGGVLEKTNSAAIFEPFVKAGIFVEIGISYNFFFTIGSEYTYLIDSVTGLGMANFSASAGYRF